MDGYEVYDVNNEYLTIRKCLNSWPYDTTFMKIIIYKTSFYKIQYIKIINNSKYSDEIIDEFHKTLSLYPYEHFKDKRVYLPKLI